MRQLNGIVTQTSNRRHRRVGHLFQGRFKAILVDHDAYLLELSRYIVLNPVRADMVKAPADWQWSSYRASAGLEPVVPWLSVDGVLSQFAKRRSLAQQRYAQFVSEGIKADSPWQNLKGQVFLGDDQFVQKMQAKIENQQRNDVQIPLAQRRARPLPLSIIERSYRASAGLEPVAPWLAVDGVLSLFAKRRNLAQQRYAQFVSEGIKADSPWQNLKGQVFLGDDQFVQQMQAKIENQQRNDVQIPVAQRRAKPLSLPMIERSAPDRNAAIVTAYATGAYSYQEIATHFGIHFTTVGRIVRGGE